MNLPLCVSVTSDRSDESCGRSPYLHCSRPTTFLYHSHLVQGTRRVPKTILIECAAVAFILVLDPTRNGDLTSEMRLDRRLASALRSMGPGHWTVYMLPLSRIPGYQRRRVHLRSEYSSVSFDLDRLTRDIGCSIKFDH